MIQIARSLINGTYGHHGHHEEHSSDGTRSHEAAHDLEHVRGEALAADVPGDFKAIGDPTHHYADDEHVGHGHHKADNGHLHSADNAHGKGMNPVVAVLLGVPLYLWNFAPHPFKPNWVMDVPMWFILLILEMIGACIKPFALTIRLFANMIAGHVIILALIGLIFMFGFKVAIGSVPMALFIMFLEILVAFIQAFVFALLASVFIGQIRAAHH